MNQLKSLKDRLPGGRDRSSSSPGAGGGSSSSGGGGGGGSSNTITGLGLRTKASSFVSSKTPSFLGGSSGTSSSPSADYSPTRPLTALRDPKEFAPPPKRRPTVHRPGSGSGSGSYQQWQEEEEDNHPQSISQSPQPALPPRRLRAETDISPFTSALAISSSPDLSSTIKKRPPPPPPPKRLNSYTGVGTGPSGSVRDTPPLPPARASTDPAGRGGVPPPLPPRLPPRPSLPGFAVMPRRGTIPMGSAYSTTDLHSKATATAASIGRGGRDVYAGRDGGRENESSSPTRRRPPPPPPTQIDSAITRLGKSGISVPSLGIGINAAPPPPPGPRPNTNTNNNNNNNNNNNTSTMSTLEAAKTAHTLSTRDPTKPPTLTELKSAYALGKEAEARHPGLGEKLVRSGVGNNGGSSVAGKKWGVVDAGGALMGKKPPVGGLR